MVREILFHPAGGLWSYFEKNPPKDHRIIESTTDSGSKTWATTDVEWAKRAVAAGVIEIVQPENEYGIKNATIVEGTLDSDPVTYKVEICLEAGTRKITLSESEILKYSVFRQKVLASLQVILPPMKREDWEDMIAPFIENAARVQEETIDNPVILAVINKVRNFERVKDKKELLTGTGNKVWFDAATDTLWLPTYELEPIADKYKITLQRLSHLLQLYRNGNSRTERIGKNLYRLWPFRAGLEVFDPNHDPT